MTEVEHKGRDKRIGLSLNLVKPRVDVRHLVVNLGLEQVGATCARVLPVESAISRVVVLHRECEVFRKAIGIRILEVAGRISAFLECKLLLTHLKSSFRSDHCIWTGLLFWRFLDGKPSSIDSEVCEMVWRCPTIPTDE